MNKPIPLKDAREGMVLAKGVVNETGMVLCAEGTLLTEPLIERFEQMKIRTIYIEQEEHLSENDYRTLKQILENRFVLSQNPNSLVGKLKTVLLRHLALQRGGKKGWGE